MRGSQGPAMHEAPLGPRGHLLSSEGYAKLHFISQKQLAREKPRPAEPRWAPALIVPHLTKTAGNSKCLTEVPGGRLTSQQQRKSLRNPGS